MQIEKNSTYKQKGEGSVIWLVVLWFRIYVALDIFQPYRDLEAGDNKFLKSQRWDQESNLGPLAP